MDLCLFFFSLYYIFHFIVIVGKIISTVFHSIAFGIFIFNVLTAN